MSRPSAAIVAWSTAIIAAALCGVGLLLSAMATAPSGDHPEVSQQAAIPVGMLAYAVIGAVIAARRPTNRVGWILLTGGLAWELFVFGTGYAGYGAFVAAGRLPAVALVALATADGCSCC